MAVNSFGAILGVAAVIAPDVATEARSGDVLFRIGAVLRKRYQVVYRQVAGLHGAFTDMAGVVVPRKDIGLDVVAYLDALRAKSTLPSLFTKAVRVGPVPLAVFPKVVFVVVFPVLILVCLSTFGIIPRPLENGVNTLASVGVVVFLVRNLFTRLALVRPVFVGAI